jgi:hypothetical protein
MDMKTLTLEDLQRLREISKLPEWYDINEFRIAVPAILDLAEEALRQRPKLILGAPKDPSPELVSAWRDLFDEIDDG